MRWLLAFLALIALAIPVAHRSTERAIAQVQVLCQTRPPGTSDNSCASTAFVATAIGGGGTVTITKGTTPTAGFTDGYVLTSSSSKVGQVAPSTTVNGQSCALGGSCTVNGVLPIANLSGSAQNTTATCVSSNTTVAIAAAIDFVNGQGIGLEHCGATFSGAAPTALTVTTTGGVGQGPTGSTHYSYQVACVDDAGGVGVASSAVTVTDGNATLGTISQANKEMAFNHITWTTACGGVALWKEIGSAGFHLVGVFGSTANAQDANVVDDSGLQQVIIPWIPDTPTGAALPDRLVTTISSGGGTTSLVLGVAPGNSASGAYTRHDDTVALLAYLTANVSAVLPAGTFNIEALTIPTTVGKLIGAGQANTILQGWSSVSTAVTADSMPDRFQITGLTINVLAQGNPDGLDVTNSGVCNISNIGVLGAALGIYLSSDVQCTVINNIVDSWYREGIVDNGGDINIIGGNQIGAGLETNQGIAVYAIASDGDNIHDNITTGGEFFAFDAFGSVNTVFQHNSATNSYREAYHLAGNSTGNVIQNNSAYGGTSSVDYCISISDDDNNSVTLADNSIINNYLNSCGYAAIGVGQFGGTSVVITDTTIVGNIIDGTNISDTAGVPAIIVGSGSGTTLTFINGNTVVSGNLDYVVQEFTSPYGTPNHTQVGTMFGLTGGSGTTSLSGTGSTALTGGSTGL